MRVEVVEAVNLTPEAVLLVQVELEAEVLVVM
jgi:hypothetical protein